MFARLPTLAGRPVVCMAALCSLYAVQGMPDKFVRVGLKNLLASQGVSTAAIGGLIAAISWPWALKWVWGPILDRFARSRMGRRRPWILVAGSGMVAMLASLLLVEALVGDVAKSIRLLGAMVLTVNLFAAMLDVAVDATAIELLPENRRGIANGLMKASLAIGSLLGGQVLGWLLLTRGLSTAVAVEIGILLLILTVPLLLRERPGDAFFSLQAKADAAPPRPDDVAGAPAANADAPVSIRQVFAALLRVMRRPSIALAAVFALASSLAHGAFVVVWPIAMQTRLGWTSEAVVTLEGAYAVPFEIAGALCGGVLASRIGSYRATLAGTLLLATAWAAHAIAPWSVRSVVFWLYLVELFAFGVLGVAMVSLFMRLAVPAIAATQFSVFMALLNLSQGGGSSLAGLVETLPPRTMFAAFAVFQAAIALPLWWVDASGAPAAATTDAAEWSD